jgi:hypothetical protein
MLNELYGNIRKGIISVMTVAFILTATTASSNKNSFTLENYIGLYELVEKNCDVIKGTFNPCDTTYFFELVMGKFSGISDSEMAYVFWSGDPKNDPELQYAAQSIKYPTTLDLSKNKLWLNRDSTTQEYLIFCDGKLDKYFVEYMTEKGRVTRRIQYTLKTTKRTDHSHLQLSYPDEK